MKKTILILAITAVGLSACKEDHLHHYARIAGMMMGSMEGSGIGIRPDQQEAILRKYALIAGARSDEEMQEFRRVALDNYRSQLKNPKPFTAEDLRPDQE
jgi:hypothetical protein